VASLFGSMRIFACAPGSPRAEGVLDAVEPDGPGDERNGDDGVAGFHCLARFGSVVKDFATELVAEDDGLVRAHEIGVAHLAVTG